MKLKQTHRWLWVLALVGCNASLLEISKPVAWQVTAKAAFWTDGHAIFSRAVPSN